MSACPSRSELEAWEAGQQDDGEVARHVVECGSCSTRLERIREQGAFLDEFRSYRPERREGGESPRRLDDSLRGYELGEVLGSGGQGFVVRAKQMATNRAVAVKILRSSAFGDDVARERFWREIQLVSRLRHPGIVTIFDAGVTRRGQPAYAMELVDGQPLSRMIPPEGFPTDRAWPLFRQIADAVAHAHAHGIIHRDLSPRNVLIDRHDQAHVLDFGLAKLTESETDRELTRSGVFAGTLAYAAPEQVDPRLGPVDARTDVHALGLLLYQLVTGEPPFPHEASLASTIRHLTHTRPQAARRLRPKLPVGLRGVLDRTLAKRPNQRHPTVKALVADLERSLPASPSRELRPRRALWYASAAILVLVVALVLSGIDWLERGDASREEDSVARRLPSEEGARGEAPSTRHLPLAELWLKHLRNGPRGVEDDFGRTSASPDLRESYWGLWNAYRANPVRRLISYPADESPRDIRLVDWRGGMAIRTLFASGRIEIRSLTGTVLRRMPPPIPALYCESVDRDGECVFATTPEDSDTLVVLELREDRLIRDRQLQGIAEDAYTSRDRTLFRLSNGVIGAYYSRLDRLALWSQEDPAPRSFVYAAQGFVVAAETNRLLLRHRQQLRVLEVSVERATGWPQVDEYPVVRPDGEPVRSNFGFQVLGDGETLLFAERPGEPFEAYRIGSEGQLRERRLSSPLPAFSVQRTAWVDPDELRLVGLDGAAVASLGLEGTEQGLRPVLRRYRSAIERPSVVACRGTTSQGRTLLVTASSHGDIEVFDGSFGLHLSRAVPGSSIHSVTVGSNDEVVIAGTGPERRGFVEVWSRALEPRQRWADVENEVTTCARILAPDQVLYTGQHGTLCRGWLSEGDAEPRVEVVHRDPRLQAGSWIAVSRAHVAWSGDYMGDSRIWLALRDAPGSAVALEPSSISRYPSCAFDGEGRLLAACDRDGLVTLWELSPAAPNLTRHLTSFAGHDLPVRGIRFLPGAEGLVTAGDDALVKVWSREGSEWSLERTIPHPLSYEQPPASQPIYSLAVHPRAPIAAIGDTEGGVFLVDLESGRMLTHFREASLMVLSLAFSSDGRYLFAGTAIGVVHRWDLEAADLLLANTYQFWLSHLQQSQPGLQARPDWSTWAERHAEPD